MEEIDVNVNDYTTEPQRASNFVGLILSVLFLRVTHTQRAGLSVWTDLLWTNELPLSSLPANGRAALFLRTWAAQSAILFVFVSALTVSRSHGGDSQVTSAPSRGLG